MPYLFDEPCVLYVYIYRILDPYVALYCPSYDQIRKEREREGEREGVGEMLRRKPKKKNKSAFPVGE